MIIGSTKEDLSLEKRVALTPEAAKNIIKHCLVIIAKGPHPIPSRTRKLSPSAPMVLCLKIWESRTLPGFTNYENS